MYYSIERILQRISDFFHHEHGVTSIEYALIAGVMTVAIISSVASSGASLNNAFTRVSASFSASSAEISSSSSSSPIGSQGNNSDSGNNGNNGKK